jgi:activator of HSP90 ATPase
MANSINVNATSVMEAVKRASQGTVSDIDAMSIAFRTLNAGVKAEMIPTIVELANKYSDTGRVAKSTRDIVEDFAYALEVSNTKMLKGYGISTVSSSRQNVFNTIVKDGRQELEKFGDQFDNTGGRLSALWSNITHAFGQGSGKIVSDVVDTSTRTEKLTKEVESLEGAVKAINNNKGIELVKFLREHNYEEGLTNAELLKKVEEDLANTRKALVEQKKEELKVEEQYQEEAKKGNRCVILTSHDQRITEYADRVLYLKDGIITDKPFF